MYFVDRNKIEQSLLYMESTLSVFESRETWGGSVEQLALERLGHVVIEAVIDVGNRMIDGFIMRDPGSYTDIIDILHNEQVIDKNDADAIKDMIELRKMLVRAYDDVNHEMLLRLLNKNLSALKAFPDCVRQYLNNELGSVSAFLPNNRR